MNSKTDSKPIEELPVAQRERLAFIDFCLYFLGEIGRADLRERFEIGTAGATRDFSKYKQLAPANMELHQKSKKYRITKRFSPLFDPMPERVLQALSHGFGEGVNERAGAFLPCEIPPRLARIDVPVLSTVSRAIYSRKVLKIEYCSVTSGVSTREIVPHGLVDSGLRWHARAYDRRRKDFIDFVLTRISKAEILDGVNIEADETERNDIEWNRIVDLKLVPHPNCRRREVVERDYPLEDGILKLRVRAAQAGYVLREWNVDCSADHRLRGDEYHLWLSDPLMLYGVRNALLAPGYEDPAKAIDKSKRI